MISNGVSTTAGRPATASTRPATPLIITHVGNLIPVKGVDLILKALKSAGLGVDIKFQVVGDGSEADSLRSLTRKLDLEELVDFKGATSPARVHDILLATDVFILASYSEGRPNALLEAMAAGVPVIASNIDSIREVVEDAATGLLFEPGNIQHLASQITRLSKDTELRRKVSKAGKNYILEQELTWNQIADKHVALYKTMIAPSISDT